MIGNYTETIEYIGSDNMSRDGKYIRVEPKECLELETSENMVDALEKLTDTIQRLRFKEATSIKLGDVFVIHLFKKQTSSELAKRKSYVYNGLIEYLYGPSRVHVKDGLLARGERSYKTFTDSNIRIILQRALQHFELSKKDVLASDKLALWLS
jgi:hypothetical protein